MGEEPIDRQTIVSPDRSLNSQPDARDPHGPEIVGANAHDDSVSNKAMLQEMATKLRRQSYIFTIASLSLILFWVNMLPLHHAATEAASKGWTYLRSRREYEQSKETFRRARKTLASTGQEIQSFEENRRMEKIQSFEEKRRVENEAPTSEEKAMLTELMMRNEQNKKSYYNVEEDRRRLSRKAGIAYDKLLAALDAIKVPFKASDFEMPLNYPYAALLWQWLLVGGAAYLLLSRRKALAMYAHILGRAQSHCPSGNPVEDCLIEAPFWLAPLPTRDGTRIGHHELRFLLGMGGRHTFAIAVCWGAALLLYSYVASTQAAVIIARSVRGGYELFLASVWATAVGAILCLAIAWFWPFRVEEYSKILPVLESSSRRKALVLLLFSGIAAPASLMWIGRLVLPSSSRRPRFLRRVKQWTRATWPRGFYLNPKSLILHYLDARRRIRGLLNHSKPNLVPYSFGSEVTEEPAPRVNVATFSYAYEAEALRELGAQNPLGAINLLFRAVDQDKILGEKGHKRSIRLYDLLAGLIVRFGSTEQMKHFQHLLVADRTHPRFSKRLTKWSNPNGDWYRRWKNGSKVHWDKLVF